jgi:tetratricopeptide (TPR) repeat protein
MRTNRAIAPFPQRTGRCAEASEYYEHFRCQSDLMSLDKSLKTYKSLLVETSNQTQTLSVVDEQLTSNNCGASGRPSNPHSRRYHILADLARVLSERYTHFGDESDLDLAVKHGQDALEICRAHSIICPSAMVFHASTLERMAHKTEDSNGWRDCELICREAILKCIDGHPLNLLARRTLGRILFRLFVATGTSTYLDEAIDLQRSLLESNLSATEDSDRHRDLWYLSAYLHARYQLSPSPHDIEASITFAAKAMQICSPMHIDKCAVVHIMVVGLQIKHHHSGALEDLNKSIDIGQQFLHSEHTTIPASRFRVALLMATAISLTRRFPISVSPDRDLHDYIELFREALRCGSSINATKGTASNLAEALCSRFDRYGNMNDLDEAIQLHRQAIHDLPAGNTLQAGSLMGLAQSLTSRFLETGHIADLDEAIDYDRMALSALPQSDIRRPTAIRNVASHLRIRFNVLRTVNDLEEAVLLLKASLSCLPPSDIDRLPTICQLSKAIMLRGQYNSDLSDIDQAIEMLKPLKGELGKLASEDGPQGLQTLSVSYLIRFHVGKDENASICAMEIVDHLLNTVAPGRHERYQCLILAAELYSEKCTSFQDISSALSYIADALQDGHRDVRSKINGVAPILSRIGAIHRDTLSVTSQISSQLLGVYRLAISLLPHIAYFAVHLNSRLESLRIGQSMALAGASHAIALSQPEQAVEILEQGRAIFWTHTLRLRSKFDIIPEDLRRQLVPLARKLEKVSNATHGTGPHDLQLIEREAADRRQMSKEFHMLVEQVRCLPGLERFMLHDEYRALAKAADGGPVIMLVSGESMCHAIALRPHHDAVGILLSSVTDAWLSDCGNAWSSAVTEARSIVRDPRKMVKSGRAKPLEGTAINILHRLWTNVVWPILNALGIQVCVHI